MIAFSHSSIERIISTHHQNTYNDIHALSKAFFEHQLEADFTGEIPTALLDMFGISKNNMSLIPAHWGGDPEQTPHLRVWTSELLGYGDAASSFTMPGPSLAMPVAQAIATKEQAKWFVSLFQNDTGLRWGAFALSESGLGSDFSHIKTTAKREGEYWVLNGTKNYIGNAARAKEGIVFANIDPARGRFGVRAFFVDFRNTSIENSDNTMHGLRCLNINDVTFNNVKIPLENILGFENGEPPHRDAFSAAQGAFNFMRPLLAASICGTTRRIAEVMAKDFSNNPEVHEKLKELEFATNCALTLCYKAAIEQEKGIDATLSSAIAKYEASQVNHAACSLVARYYGSSLYLAENALIEKLFRDSYCFRFMEGTEDNQRNLINQVSLRKTRFRRLVKNSRLAR
ncbi:acyl-CoA/acyl-ACP dehydrogenase [Vibrio sp.]|nr:acyl-CoA/acyl-ACP dehydrogenase [Vibrio sp.]